MGAVIPLGKTIIGFFPTKWDRKVDFSPDDEEDGFDDDDDDLDDDRVSLYNFKIRLKSFPALAWRMDAEFPTGIS